MKNAILKYGLKVIFCVLLISPVLLFAQTTNPTPQPQPTPASTPPPRQVTDEIIRRNQEVNRLRNVQENLRIREESRVREEKLKIARNTIGELYRKPTKDELRTVEIDRDLLGKYAAFLRQKDAGIVKLLDNSNCSQNSKVVVATANCLNSTMPGAGSAFSFRTNNYRLTNLADLNFLGNSFASPGIWSHGILVNLGTISLDTLDNQTDSFKFINSIVPAFEYENAKDFSFKLVNGINSGNLSYRSSVPVVENSTYLLRSIAYRGTVNKSVEGFIYNELDYDERKDIIVSFQVVRKHPDGAVTLIWKKLATKDSPKIKKEKMEADSKMKKNDYIGSVLN